MFIAIQIFLKKIKKSVDIENGACYYNQARVRKNKNTALYLEN